MTWNNTSRLHLPNIAKLLHLQVARVNWEITLNKARFKTNRTIRQFKKLVVDTQHSRITRAATMSLKWCINTNNRSKYLTHKTLYNSRQWILKYPKRKTNFSPQIASHLRIWIKLSSVILTQTWHLKLTARLKTTPVTWALRNQDPRNETWRLSPGASILIESTTLTECARIVTILAVGKKKLSATQTASCTLKTFAKRATCLLIDVPRSNCW